MPTAKEILNELKWREDREFHEVEVTYIHRGAPNDVMVIRGEQILDLESSFMKTESAMIPYHRVIRISYKDDVIWERH